MVVPGTQIRYPERRRDQISVDAKVTGFETFKSIFDIFGNISDIIYECCKGKIRVNIDKKNAQYVQEFIVAKANALSDMFNAALAEVESWKDEKGTKIPYRAEPTETLTEPALLDMKVKQPLEDIQSKTGNGKDTLELEQYQTMLEKLMREIQSELEVWLKNYLPKPRATEDAGNASQEETDRRMARGIVRTKYEER